MTSGFMINITEPVSSFGSIKEDTIKYINSNPFIYGLNNKSKSYLSATHYPLPNVTQFKENFNILSTRRFIYEQLSHPCNPALSITF